MTPEPMTKAKHTDFDNNVFTALAIFGLFSAVFLVCAALASLTEPEASKTSHVEYYQSVFCFDPAGQYLPHCEDQSMRCFIVIDGKPNEIGCAPLRE